MKERLKQVRTKLHYSQQKMATILGVELNTYRGYEYKTKNFPDDFLKALLVKLQVNINWLLLGCGDMFITGKSETSITFTSEEVEKIKQILLNVDKALL